MVVCGLGASFAISACGLRLSVARVGKAEWGEEGTGFALSVGGSGLDGK